MQTVDTLHTSIPSVASVPSASLRQEVAGRMALPARTLRALDLRLRACLCQGGLAGAPTVCVVERAMFPAGATSQWPARFSARTKTTDHRRSTERAHKCLWCQVRESDRSVLSGVSGARAENPMVDDDDDDDDCVEARMQAREKTSTHGPHAVPYLIGTHRGRSKTLPVSVLTPTEGFPLSSTVARPVHFLSVFCFCFFCCLSSFVYRDEEIVLAMVAWSSLFATCEPPQLWLSRSRRGWNV